MGQIAPEQAEWAVVDRLRQMLEAPEGAYLASQSYALFSSILCWAMQHMRIHADYQLTDGDGAASALMAELENEQVNIEPWCVCSEPAGPVEGRGLTVPPPEGFENHSAARLLRNLRDAMAHGDARKVQPFNHGEILVGFTFNCSELKKRKVDWQGRIVLLRADMQRIGCSLASRYCAAIKAADQSGELEARAAAMIEDAA
ncbi:hypothetical protein [Pontixanthobacter luteolus]|uniref:hypothetical protein n=1 Tax=Pontixanthobacter luteolus TaxID=295089 RepID=UPI0023042C54|nr:hypothetical protein [Pontixanthobacter luteolus]